MTATHWVSGRGSLDHGNSHQAQHTHPCLDHDSRQGCVCWGGRRRGTEGESVEIKHGGGKGHDIWEVRGTKVTLAAGEDEEQLQRLEAETLYQTQ